MDSSAIRQRVPQGLTPEEAGQLNKIFENPNYFKRGYESPFDRDRLNARGSEGESREYKYKSGEVTLQFMIDGNMHDAIKDLVLNLLRSKESDADEDLKLLLKTLKEKKFDFQKIKLDPLEVFFEKGSLKPGSIDLRYGTLNAIAFARVADNYEILKDILPPTAKMLHAVHEIKSFDSRSPFRVSGDNLEAKINELPEEIRLSIFISSMDEHFLSQSFTDFRNTSRNEIRRFTLDSWQKKLRSMAVIAVRQNKKDEFNKIIGAIGDICSTGIEAPPSLLGSILEMSQPKKGDRINLDPFIQALFAQKYTFRGTQRPLVQFDFEKDSRPLQTCVDLDTASKEKSKAIVALCMQNMKPITRWSQDFVSVLKDRVQNWALIPELHPMLTHVLQQCPRNKIKKGEMEALLIPSQTFSPLTIDILRLHDNVGMGAQYLKDSVGGDSPKSLHLENATIGQLQSVFANTSDGDFTRAPYMRSHKHVQDWLDVIDYHADLNPGSVADDYQDLLQSILIDCYKPGIFTRTFGMGNRYEKILNHIETLKKNYINEDTGADKQDAVGLQVLIKASALVSKKQLELRPAELVPKVQSTGIIHKVLIQRGKKTDLGRKPLKS